MTRSRTQRAHRTDVNQVINELRDEGCEVELARSGHWQVRWHGRLVGTVSNTPSDRRSLLNARSHVRRLIRQARLEIKETRP